MKSDSICLIMFSFFFLKFTLVNLDPLCIHINFMMNVSVSTKHFQVFLLEFYWIYRSVYEKMSHISAQSLILAVGFSEMFLPDRKHLLSVLVRLKLLSWTNAKFCSMFLSTSCYDHSVFFILLMWWTADSSPNVKGAWLSLETLPEQAVLSLM